MWAWADAHELLNTAVLTGQQVSTALRGVLVRNWGISGSGGSSNSGDALSGCSIAATASGPRAASVAIDSLRQLCSVNVNAANTVPAKGMAVTLTIQAGALAAQSAQVQAGSATAVASLIRCQRMPLLSSCTFSPAPRRSAWTSGCPRRWRCLRLTPRSTACCP